MLQLCCKYLFFDFFSPYITMLLQELSLKNYKQYTDLQLNFKEGLVGIIGKNGTGKSTIFDAVVHCLFGKDEDEKSYIRSVMAPETAPVELLLIFEVGNTPYKVLRKYRGKDLSKGTIEAELYDENKKTLLASSAKEVNAQISKIIGMEYDAFKRSVFSGQKELAELSTAKPAQRKELVRKILGVERLEVIQKNINSDKTAIANEIKGKQETLLSNEALQQKNTEIAEINANIERLQQQQQQTQQLLRQQEEQQSLHQTQWAAEEQKMRHHNEQINKLNRLEANLESLQQQLKKEKEQAQQLQQLQQQCADQQNDINTFQQQKQEIEQLRQQAQQQAEYEKKQATLLAHKTQLDELREIVTKRKEELKPLPDLKQQTEQLRQQEHQWQQTIQQQRLHDSCIDQQIQQLKGKIKDYEQKIDKLQSLNRNAPCPTCAQPLLDMYESTLNTLRSEVEAAAAEMQPLTIQKQNAQEQLFQSEQNLAACRNNIHIKDKEYNTLVQMQRQQQEEIMRGMEIKKIMEHIEDDLKTMPAFTLDKLYFEQLQQNYKRFEPTYQQYIINKNRCEKDTPLVLQNIGELEQRLEKGKEMIQTAHNDIQKIDFVAKHYEALKIKQQEIANQLTDTRQQISGFQVRQERLNGDKKLLQAAIEQQQHIQEQIQSRQQEADVLGKLYELVREFKNNILLRISPLISNEASLLFSQITKGKYEHISVDDNFEFHIIDGGKAYPISRFSGGEQDLANLCLRIALSKAITELSGQQAMNFLAFDEIFGSQDEDRRQEILFALRLLQEQFQQIYIISHAESIINEFPNILQVSHQSGSGSCAQWLD